MHYKNIQKGVIQNISIKTGKTDIVLTPNQTTAIKKIADLFEQECEKGILLIGNAGTGKTTIMEVVCRYYYFLTGKIVKSIHAKNLPAAIFKNNIPYFYKRPLFVDDLGKESPITNIFGQKYDTWGDIFSIRYENRALTFATSNYKLEGQFKEIYGNIIVDRMKEHFYIVELVGDSLRTGNNL